MSCPAMSQETESETWISQKKEVRVFMEMLDLGSIDSVSQTFNASFYFELVWLDDSLKHAGPGSLKMKLNEINGKGVTALC